MRSLGVPAPDTPGMLPPKAHYRMSPPWRPAMPALVLGLARSPCQHWWHRGAGCQERVGMKVSPGYPCLSSFGSTAGIQSDKRKTQTKKKSLENQLAAKGNYQRTN